MLVYPGGDYEVFRPSWESGQVDFGGRKGFIRLALKLGGRVLFLAHRTAVHGGWAALLHRPLWSTSAPLEG